MRNDSWGPQALPERDAGREAADATLSHESHPQQWSLPGADLFAESLPWGNNRREDPRPGPRDGKAGPLLPLVTATLGTKTLQPLAIGEGNTCFLQASKKTPCRAALQSHLCLSPGIEEQLNSSTSLAKVAGVLCQWEMSTLWREYTPLGRGSA